MTDQLPAVLPTQSLAVPSDTYIVPAMVAALGDQASWRYVEFFVANIPNDHTRRAYVRACSGFFVWCEQRSLTLIAIRPFDVGAWVKELQEKHGAPGVKQQLAAVRMLFDWLVTGQVVPMNPAAAVRGPKHVVKTGKTPVLDGAEWHTLLDSIPTETVRDLRDRALIATLTYSFARIGAALRMKVEDLRPKGAGWQIQLHEKGGKDTCIARGALVSTTINSFARSLTLSLPAIEDSLPHIAGNDISMRCTDLNARGQAAAGVR